MGNCQAAEAAAVLIQHPGGRVERLYWSLSASQVMASNPGHYVALVITTTTSNNNRNSSGGNTAAPVKHLKLLRPDDTLHIGHVYSLVSFEEVLKEFVSKKHVKLSRLVVAHRDKGTSKRGGGGGRGGGRAADAKSSTAPVAVEAEQVQWVGSGGSRRGGGGAPPRQGQWRPALQSIAETAS